MWPQKFSWGIAPISRFSFITVKRHCIEDHWTSEVAIPVNSHTIFCVYCSAEQHSKAVSRCVNSGGCGDVTPSTDK